MNATRRTFLKHAGAGLCLSALAPIPGALAQQRDTPNIVLVLADDQGWGDMGYNGHEKLKTPHFDALAREGIRFDRFYAAAPVCSPTRGSIMTGRHPNRFACFTWGGSLRPQEITVAEALKTAGYATGHFGKWHLGSVREGSPVNPGTSGFDTWLSAPNFFENDPLLSREGKAVQTQGESSMVAVDAALEFIRKHAEKQQPFLAVVCFGSPHKPHIAAPAHREPYKEEPERLQDFYGEITGMDAAFGKLRSELEAIGVRENTLLWYCSDNGGLPQVGSTGGRGHKGDIYEGGLRVPALLEWPARFQQPAVIPTPCVSSDMYPTLLSLAGVQMENQPPLDGIDLQPMLNENATQRAAPIGFWSYPAEGLRTPSDEWMQELLEAQSAGAELKDDDRLRLDAGDLSKRYPMDQFPGHAAWLDWPWKLHRIEEEQDAVRLELYNLDEDPMETADQSGAQPERVEKMRGALDKWQTSVLRSLNGEDYA